MIFSTIVITSLLSLLSFARAAAIPSPNGVHFVCPESDTAGNPLIQPSPIPTQSPVPTPPSQASPVPSQPNKHTDDGKTPNKTSDDGKTPTDNGKTNGGKLPSGDDKFKYIFCAYTANDHCAYDKVRADRHLTCNSAHVGI